MVNTMILLIISTVFTASFVNGQLVCDSNSISVTINFPEGYNRFQPAERIDVLDGKPRMVNVTLFVNQVKDVYDDLRTIDLSMSARFNWADERLMKEAGCIGIIDEGDFQKMWKPNVVLNNADEVKKRPGLEGNAENVIYAEYGYFWWDLELSIKFFCDMDFAWYPMDIQVCKFRIVSASLPDTMLKFYNTEKSESGIFQAAANNNENELPYHITFRPMPVDEELVRYKNDENFFMSSVGFDIVLERRKIATELLLSGNSDGSKSSNELSNHPAPASPERLLHCLAT